MTDSASVINLHVDSRNILETKTIEVYYTIEAAKEVAELLAWAIYEPRREKTGLRGFQPGATQIGLYSYRSRLDA